MAVTVLLISQWAYWTIRVVVHIAEVSVTYRLVVVVVVVAGAVAMVLEAFRV